VRPIPAYKAGLYGLTENRQLSNSNPKPAFIPVHRTGFSACFNKIIHELDINLEGKFRKRNIRSETTMIQYTNKLMSVAEKLLKAADEKLNRPT